VLVDTATGEKHTPLNHLSDNQAPYTVYNSLLAEVSVLGFEYGYSTARPEGLSAWEAQFGDFANNAQSVIDLFIASGETKWQRLSGLVLLLPHGLEGLGPEHSSARLERFLQLCADDNMQVCYPSTPSQYFHLLRRQVKAAWRKPLVVMTPKSLLRHPAAVSTLEELSAGAFREVIDQEESGENIERVVLCSGKLYYALRQRQQELKDNSSAIIRIEQFYPFPEKQLSEVLSRYSKARQWLWVQEEPENMGGWHFVRYRLEKMIGKPLAYVGRDASPSPASGFPLIYRQRQERIIDQAIGKLPQVTSDQIS
jgi:2-oxoglutarate dehydrogenase E1 component